MNIQKSNEVFSSIKGDENKFVTFTIGEEVYGVDVRRVQEIIGMTPITPMPNAISFMKGVINLRGTVVPVIDMRLKFRMPPRDYDAFTVIIIVEVKERLIGMIVDNVADVVDIPPGTIQETPRFTTRIETHFIQGIGKVDSVLVIILDVESIMTAEELVSLDSMNGTSA